MFSNVYSLVSDITVTIVSSWNFRYSLYLDKIFMIQTKIPENLPNYC